jgi:hypothetical protein
MCQTTFGGAVIRLLLLVSDSSTQYHSLCPPWRNHQDTCTWAAYYVYGVDSKFVVPILLQYFSIAHEVCVRIPVVLEYYRSLVQSGRLVPTLAWFQCTTL